MQEGQDQVATATDYTIFDNASTRTLMDLGSDTQDLSCSHITSEDEENNAVVKDPQYYFPEGDCAIRVGDTLFRVRVPQLK